MSKRSFIRDGDTTDCDGIVQARPQQFPTTYNGAHAAFEGDPVWCPKCESHGISKCVPPRRSSTGADGRQNLLDGDLCLCRCPIPPRLKARFHNVCMGFNDAEIRAQLAASAGWLEYAGLAAQFPREESARSGGKTFCFVDSETREPMANRKFVVQYGNSIHEGHTDSNGVAVVQAASGKEFSIHLVFHSPKGEMGCILPASETALRRAE